MHWSKVVVVVSLLVLSVGLVALGDAEDDAYWSAVDLEIGAACFLLVPFFLIEEVLRAKVKSLQEEVDELRAATRGSSEAFDLLRAVMPSSGDRTGALEGLLDAARNHAASADVTQPQVSRMFRDATADGERVMALAMMQGRPSAVDPSAVLEAIRNPRSAFEQYHALRVAELAWSLLAAERRTAVLEAIRVQTGSAGSIKPGGDRSAVARRIATLAGTVTA